MVKALQVTGPSWTTALEAQTRTLWQDGEIEIMLKNTIIHFIFKRDACFLAKQGSVPSTATDNCDLLPAVVML